MSDAKGPYTAAFIRKVRDAVPFVDGATGAGVSETQGVIDHLNHALAAQAERVKDLELLVSIYKRASDALDGMGYTLPHSTPLGDDERRWYERGISTTKRCFREAFEEAVQEATDAALTPPVKETT